MADNNNPIKYSDLVKPDDSISRLTKELEDLKKQLDGIKDSAITLRANLQSVSGATESNRKVIKEASAGTDKLLRAERELAFVESEKAKQLALVKKATAEANEMNKLAAKLANSAAGSYNKLSAQYSINKIALNNMSLAEREATEEGRELVKETNAIYEEMKRLQSETGKNQLNVGNYGEAWGVVNDQMGQLPGVAGQAVGGIKSVSAAATMLSKNPLILVLSSLIAIFTILFGLFTKTEKGADGLAKVGAILSGVFSALVGVADRLFKGLMQVFEDPQKAMLKFWNALKQNIVNRLTGVVDLVKALGAAFKALWERDMEGLKNAAKDAGTALLQLNTGLDAQQQKAFAAAVRDTTASIVDQAKAFGQLEAAKRGTRRSNRELEKQLEGLLTQEALLTAVADDQTKSFADREAAAARAAKVMQSRAGVEAQIARANLSLINQELALRRANGEEVEDLLDSQLSAYKALASANRSYTLSQRENQKRVDELKQDRLEKDLDILIDGFDNQKTINERIIKDETKTFEERRALLDQTKALFEDTFNKQIETIQKFTGVNVNANDLIAESDAVMLNAKIRALGLSEIIEGRLLEVIRERRTFTQDLAESEKELNNSQAKAREKAAEDAKKKAEEQAKAQKELYDSRIKDLDVSLEIANYEIDLMEESERKKTDLRLKAERDRIKAVIALNKTGNKQLTDQELKAAELAVKVMDKQIRNNMKDNKDIYDVFGLDLDDDKKAAISASVQYAVDALNTFLSAKIAAADKAVDAADREVDATQRRLDSELQARANGYASNVVAAQKELDLAKKNQDKALREQQKAQKAQQAIQAAQQASSLITASALIWSQLGFPWAIPAIATMWGSFAFSQIKAAQLSKQSAQSSESYGDGTVELLGGGSHQSGRDVDLGSKPDGTRRRAEGGEFFAVINKRNSRRYRNIIPNVIRSLNNGSFESKYLNAFKGDGMSIKIDGSGKDTDLKDLSSDVREIRDQNRRRYHTNGKGQTVEIYKNLKRVIKN